MLKRKERQALQFLFSQKKFKIEQLEIIEGEGITFKVNREKIFIGLENVESSSNVEYLKENFEAIINDVQTFELNRHLFTNTKLERMISEIQQTID